MKKIRELGSLPSDAFEKYQSFNLKQVPYFIFLIPLLKNSYIHVKQPHYEQFLFDIEVAFAIARASSTFNSL